MQAAGGSDASSVMRSLERSLDILAVLESRMNPMRLSEIAQEAGLHRATAQRILQVLSDRDYVHQDARGYTIGVRTLLNAHAFLLSTPLVVVGTPVMHQLAELTGLTATLSCRVDASQVILVRVRGGRPMPYELPVGERLPLHVGAGRVLAAGLPPAERRSFAARIGTFTTAGGATVTEDELLEELAEISRAGIAFSVSQRVLGAASLCVPVIDRDGAVIAAVQVSGTASDFSEERRAALASQLSHAAWSLSARLV